MTNENNSLYLLSVSILAIPLFGASAIISPLLEICECEPSITGEMSDGGDVKKLMTNQGPLLYVAEATLINEGEIEGRCFLGSGSACPLTAKTCKFQLKAKVKYTSGDLTVRPKEFKVAGVTTVLVPTYDAFGEPQYPYEATTAQSFYPELGCEGTLMRTVQGYDTDGNLISEATFELKCGDCQ